VTELPTIEMPAPLAEATAKLASRDEQAREAEKRVSAATEAVSAAHLLDVEEIARAREEGKRDPQPTHEEEALAALRAAEHELEVEQARLATVRRQYEDTLKAQREPWRKRIETTWKKVDRAQKRRLAELEAGVDEVHALSVAWLVMDALAHDPGDAERVLRKASGPLGRTEIDFTGVGEAIEAASCEVVTREVIETRREWDDRLAEERRSAKQAAEEARAEAEARAEREQARRTSLGLS